MKRNLLFIIVASLCMLASRAGVITHSETFDLSGWSKQTVTVDTSQYILISYEGLGHITEEGSPKLPVKYVQLVIPYNATNLTISCSYTSATTESTAKILPVETHIVTNDDNTVFPIIKEDSLIYNSITPFPAKLGEIVSDGYFMGDNRIITIAIHPATYNNQLKQVTYYNGINVMISYENEQLDQAYLLQRYRIQDRAKDQALLEGFVRNPEQIQTFAAPWQESSPSSFAENYDYTIITTHDLKSAFRRLITLKQQQGYSAGVVCIEDILNNPFANQGDSTFDIHGNLISVITDSAGIVRQYLKEAFRKGTKYVLFGGNNLPFRYGGILKKASENKDTFTENDISYKIPTDLYFTDLSSPWRHITSNVYDSNYYSISLNLPIGRLLCKTAQDVNNYTSKLLRYELNPGNGITDYLQRAYFFEAKGMFSESTRVIPYFANSMDTVFVEQEAINAPFNSGKDIIDRLNTTKFGFISIHGHGNPNGIKVGNSSSYSDRRMLNSLNEQWVISNPNRFYHEFGNGLDCMTNQYEPSICYSISCSTTPFDILSENNFVYNVHRNFGDSFTSGKKYGGVAFLGNTRDGYIGLSADLEGYFIEEIFSHNPSIGIAESISKFRYKNDKYGKHLCYTHNLIGDPEVQMWTSTPSIFSNINVSKNYNSITVSGDLSNQSIVTYNDGVNLQSKSPIDGSVTFFSTLPRGIVQVNSPNTIPYISPLVLQNCTISHSQYVITSNAIIGRDISPYQTTGDIIISTGSQYEIESAKGVEITSGFSVEKGAFLGIYPTSF